MAKAAPSQSTLAKSALLSVSLRCQIVLAARRAIGGMQCAVWASNLVLPLALFSFGTTPAPELLSNDDLLVGAQYSWNRRWTQLLSALRARVSKPSTRSTGSLESKTLGLGSPRTMLCCFGFDSRTRGARGAVGSHPLLVRRPGIQRSSIPSPILPYSEPQFRHLPS
jgi:hypothetical protein